MIDDLLSQTLENINSERDESVRIAKERAKNQTIMVKYASEVISENVELYSSVLDIYVSDGDTVPEIYETINKLIHETINIYSKDKIIGTKNDFESESTKVDLGWIKIEEYEECPHYVKPTVTEYGMKIIEGYAKFKETTLDKIIENNILLKDYYSGY